ncbi:MAG: flagellar biosynthesis protein FlhF [Desulfobacterales bacterium]|nr:flagellar biosynthesis protein FlhF [Desulfobacterales bacterium]
MQIKRFEAENMTEALRLVKQEFGSEAVILSARSLKKKRGVFWPMKRPGAEVTAAKDTSCTEAKEAPPNKMRKFYKNQSLRSNLEDSSKKKSSVSLLHGEANALKNRHNNHMVKRNHVPQNNARELFALHQRMLFQGIEENIALDLIEKINRIMSSENVLKNEELKSCLIHAFEKTGLRASPIKMEEGKQKIVAFVGPTGVGKTTTIAKLAAIQAIKMRKRVALITLDNYRIAGIEQLKIYAKIIGIPIEIVSTGKEFKECLNRLEDKDLILIDTAGMSQGNEYQFNELRIFFDKIRHVETHLLLSATTKENDLVDILARFKVFPISKLLFTKLDESTSYGNMLNQIIQSKIPVSYFTNGQQVPEDIEIATLERLVDLITDQEKDGRHFSESYVASKDSFFFHCFDCQLVKEIKQEDIIVFERAIDAVNKQLKPCGLCCPDKVEKQNLYSWDANKRKNGTYQ